MNTIPYQIVIAWSPADEAYEASIPALKGCMAYGDTPAQATEEVTIAAELWLEAAARHGKKIPIPGASLTVLALANPILNMSAIAREARISVQTLAAKLQRGTPLTDDEQRGIGAVLEAHGLRQ